MTISIEAFLKETIHSVCTLPALKNICKVRGFINPPSKGGKTALADYVQLRFMNGTGLQEAFSQLDIRALIVLHFLKLTGEPQTVERLCPFLLEKSSKYYYNQDIKQTFEKIIELLVSSGVVLVKYDHSKFRRSNDNKWVGYVVHFPQEFVAQLPPLQIPSAPISVKAPSAKWATVIVEIIVQNICKKPVSFPFKEITLPKFNLVEGMLKLEGKLHPTHEEVHHTLLNKWLHCQGFNKNDHTMGEAEIALKQNAMVRKYILQSIPSGHGIKKEDLEKQCALLQCPFVGNELAVFINAGLHFGFLAKQVKNEIEYLIPQLECSLDNISSLPIVPDDKNGKVRVRLNENWSLDELLTLAKASSLSVAANEVIATPCPKYIGRMFVELTAHPFIKQLLANSITFRAAFEAIKERTGKIAIHSGLIIIKLNSMDIESVLLSKYSESMIKMGESCYAVSQENLPELIQYGKKKGFTPKFINSQAKG